MSKDQSRVGFVALYRRLLDHPLWTQFPAEWLKAWLYLLLRANHKPLAWWDGTREIQIPTGGLVTSIEKLATGSRISRGQARGSLDYFEKAGMVTRQASNRHSIITITNWPLYQFSCVDDDIPYEAERSKQTTDQQHAGRQAHGTPGDNSTTNKQLTRENSCSPSGEPLHDLLSPPFGALDEQPPVEHSKPTWGTPEKQRAFEEFWWVWPRKIAKAAAEKVFCRQASSRETADKIIDAVRVQLPHLTADLKYCPYPATWLNQKRYEDDPAEMQRSADSSDSLYTPDEADE